MPLIPLAKNFEGATINVMSHTAILLLALSAQAAPALNTETSNLASFPSFVSEVRSAGKDNKIGPNIGPLLGVAPNAASKAFILEKIGRVNGATLGKSCNYVLPPDSSTAAETSSSLLFLTSTRGKRRAVGRYFKTSYDGTLALAMEVVTKLDKDGKPIRGSGVKKVLNIASSTTKQAFQDELKFWLSGEYKKHLLRSK